MLILCTNLEILAQSDIEVDSDTGRDAMDTLIAYLRPFPNCDFVADSTFGAWTGGRIARQYPHPVGCSLVRSNNAKEAEIFGPLVLSILSPTAPESEG